MTNISEFRMNYDNGMLELKDLQHSPFDQFAQWMKDAVHCEDEIEPNAMTLSSLGENFQVNARIVLCKGYSEKGFTFFTNYNSQKGKELALFPKVALTFWWRILQRQVRILGSTTKVGAGESDEYFYSRPIGSQIGAIASPQSNPIPSRDILTERAAQIEEDLESIRRPDHWGGYLVKPTQFEFWQGRENRLHDRFQYSLSGDGSWSILQLAP